jgi:two-component system sensor histidine kinase/response regulator
MMNNTRKEHRRKYLVAWLCFFACLPLSANNEMSAADRQIEQTVQTAHKAEGAQNAPQAAQAYAEAIALTRRQPQNKQKDLPLLLYSYGLMLTYAGQYEDAVAPLDEAIRRAHAAGDKKTEARSLTQTGIINFFLNDWDRALYFYRRAEVLAKELGNKQGLSIITNDISNIYQKKHNYRRAIAGYQHTLEMQRELNDSATICNTLFNIATCYEELHIENLAEEYMQRTYQIASVIRDAEIYALSASHIARYELMRGNTGEAKRLFDMAEELTRESEYKQVRAEVYRVRSTALEDAGDNKGALAYYKKMKTLNDSLQKEEAQKRIDELQVKYKTAEKEHIVELQQEELRQQRILQGVLGVAVVICLVVIYFINRYRRLVRRRNRELRAMNYVKDKFFSIISHDLKNPVIAQKESLATLVYNYDSLTADDIHGVCLELLESSKSLLDLLFNLLNWSRMQTKRLVYTPANFPIVDTVREVSELVNMQLVEKNLSLHIDIPDYATVYADHYMIGTLIRNLVGNAIKFSYDGGGIEVRAVQQGNMWNISVSDHGIGMKQSVVKALFHVNGQVINAGTNGEKGSGLGLVVCHDIIEAHNSVLCVNSKEGEGTTFSFLLPDHANKTDNSSKTNKDDNTSQKII